MRAICLVLLDGLGDRAYAELGGRTANEAAATPILDALCARGSCGLLWPLGPGRAPASEVAHWRMLGYADEEFPGRALLEAGGAGPEPSTSTVYGYAALRPAERRGGALWLTGRPGPEDEADTVALVEAVREMDLDGFTFSLEHLGQGEAILRVGGGADDAITDTDSFFRDRDPVLCPRPLRSEAHETAAAVETWSRRVHYELLAHPVNVGRARAGRPTLNVITVKWWGRPRSAPPFLERHGVGGTIVAASRLHAGLAATLGLRYLDAADAGLGVRLQQASAALNAGDGFVLVHTKAIDEAGHSKSPHERLHAVGEADAALAALLESPFTDVVVCVTGDHATPASANVIHSGDPVPFVLVGPGVRADRTDEFGELSCREGVLGHLRGEDVMPVLLNAADRALFAGSRPTPTPGALGYPSRPQPLEP